MSLELWFTATRSGAPSPSTSMAAMPPRGSSPASASAPSLNRPEPSPRSTLRSSVAELFVARSRYCLCV